MTATFWINSYLRAALPAIGVVGFNAGFALNITMSNVSGATLVAVAVALTLIGKLAFSHLASKESYLWFLGEDAKKSRLVIGYARLIGVGIFLGTPLMSVAQFGDTSTTIFAVLVMSWIFLTEGFKFDRTVKDAEK